MAPHLQADRARARRPCAPTGSSPWLRANLLRPTGRARWPPHRCIGLRCALRCRGLSSTGCSCNAVFRPDADACQAARGTGACWGVIAREVPLHHLRPLSVRASSGARCSPRCCCWALLVASCMRRFWRPWLALLWVAVLAAFFVPDGRRLLRPDAGAAPTVGRPAADHHAGHARRSCSPSRCRCWWRWAGARKLPAIRTAVHRLRRADPRRAADLGAVHGLVPVPAVHAAWASRTDVLLRVLVGITLFAAAYLAEIGARRLQAIPKGQLEAADTLGLSYWQTQRKIVLPQALAHGGAGHHEQLHRASSRTPRWSPSSACTS